MVGTVQYWLLLVMFCVAAVVTMAVGSVLQYRAIAQQAASASHAEAVTASLLPPTYSARSAYH
jgi:hypothetical protein